MTRPRQRQPYTGSDVVNGNSDNFSTDILIVEDDRSAMENINSILEKKFPEERFHKACNGVQGLKMFRKLHPAIVLTDISMPELDGLSMASEIKSLCPETVIIAMTAHSETNNLLRAIEVGITHYLLKPICCERLFSVIDRAIRNVMQEHQLHNSYAQINQCNLELMAKSRELESANRDLEAFNYTVAHDLRSPLVSINAFSHFVLDLCTGAIDEKIREYAQVINREALRMSTQIDAMLRFSSCSKKKIEKQWTDLSSIAHRIKDNLLLRNPDRQVEFCISNGVNGFCDPALMTLVIENLFDNAWKYSSGSEDAHIEFDVMTRGEDLVYFVRDNGIGFENKESANLFAPFQRISSDKVIEGFGIGLATVDRIIQRHGGRIWADGEKGHGATVYFTL